MNPGALFAQYARRSCTRYDRGICNDVPRPVEGRRKRTEKSDGGGSAIVRRRLRGSLQKAVRRGQKVMRGMR